MKFYAIYNQATGEIVRYGSCGADSDVYLQAVPDGCNRFVNDDIELSDAMYIPAGALMGRPKLAEIPEGSEISADGQDVVRLTLPSGTLVSINRERLGETDGADLEITAPVPGVYAVDLVPPFPYLPASFVVTAS